MVALDLRAKIGAMGRVVGCGGGWCVVVVRGAWWWWDAVVARGGCGVGEEERLKAQIQSTRQAPFFVEIFPCRTM